MATLVYGIAASQGFYEGNKRTALILSQRFWADNADESLKNLFKGEDPELAELLERAAKGERVRAEVVTLIRERIKKTA